MRALKSTGIVRKIDELGRIVLPVECRRGLELEDKDSLEVFMEDNTIVLKKYEPACIFCGESRGMCYIMAATSARPASSRSKNGCKPAAGFLLAQAGQLC